LKKEERRRVEWKLEEQAVGYVEDLGPLRVILIKNAGHGPSTDQPSSVLAMISTFINGPNFSKSHSNNESKIRLQCEIPFFVFSFIVFSLLGFAGTKHQIIAFLLTSWL
jgi:hypothetical protein